VSTATSVARRLLWRSALSWLGAFFVVFGAVFFSVGVHDFREGVALRQHGVTATATVVSRRIKQATGKDQPATEYQLGYTFHTAANQLMAGVVVVPVEQWEATKEGAPLQVHYPADRPYESRLASDGGWGVAPGFVPAGAVFLAVGLTLVILQWRRWRLVVNLLEHGAVAEGTLTHVGVSGVSVNLVRQWRLDYEFTDAAGERRTGKTPSMSPQIARRWKNGDRGSVRYDARDPRRSIWVDVEVPKTRLAR
jgi:hypothetical protein